MENFLAQVSDDVDLILLRDEWLRERESRLDMPRVEFEFWPDNYLEIRVQTAPGAPWENFKQHFAIVLRRAAPEGTVTWL